MVCLGGLFGWFVWVVCLGGLFECFLGFFWVFSVFFSWFSVFFFVLFSVFFLFKGNLSSPKGSFIRTFLQNSRSGG